MSEATSTGKRAPVVSSWTTAYAVVPSADTCPAPSASHGDDHVDHVRQRTESVDHGLGHGADGLGPDSRVVVDHDGDGVAGPVREPLVEKLDGGLGVRAGREELLLALASEHGPGEVHGHQDRDPREPRPATGAGTTTK